MADAARAPLDRIRLEALRLTTVVGVHAHERLRAREVVLDVTLHADLSRAGASDELAHTIDYQALEDALAQVVGEARDLLIERLAERVAERCLAHPGVERVDVRLAKPGALPRTGTVAVELSRTREGPGEP
jgi:FolB domain-containing protein